MEEELQKEIQNDIYKIVNELKRTTSDSLYYDLTSKLYFLNEIIVLKDLEINYPKEFEFEWFKKSNKNKKDAFEKAIFNTAQENYTLDLRIAKMSNVLFDRYLIKEGIVPFKYVPFDRSLELAIDFYKRFDEEIYNFLIDTINSPRFVLVDNVENLEGWSLKNNYLVDSYTVVSPYNLISDFLTIIHEIMHSFNNKLTKNNSINENEKVFCNALYEAPSFFIEKVGLDYLSNFYDKKEINKLRMISDTETCFLLRDFKEMLLSGFSDYGQYLDKLTYVYGNVLSYHFYDNYLKDKDKTIKDLKQFMVDYKTYDRKYLLNNYGLKQDNITNPQKLTKHMDKHLVRLNHE